MEESFEFDAPLWEWEGKAAWVFVTLPDDVSAELRELPRMPRGFGSIRVRVRIGATTWSTSIFPQSSSRPYLLPVKRAVREANGVDIGDVVHVALEVVD